MDIEVFEHLEMYSLESLKIQTLVVESEVLRSNPLKDSHIRYNPVVLPKADPPASGWPVICFLSGFAGNGTKAFSDKGFDDNTVQVLDRAILRGDAPRGVYVFVDAWTSWGGSQFINSEGMGDYQDYILKELVPQVKANFPCETASEFWTVMGGSSGGYGALHLSSTSPETFSRCVAIAPDCFFEASLIPEVYTAVPIIEKLGGVSEVRSALDEGKFLRGKSSFSALNAIAMTLCYSPQKNKDGLAFPINRRTGVRDEEVWQRWMKNDPIHFLPERVENIKKLSGIFLEVGTRDQYHLQYGARQIKEVLKTTGVDLHYSEFDGTHNEIGERRVDAWKWLKKSWKKS